MFTTAKDDGLIPYVLTQILDACVNGITLSDPDLPDNPIVYANKVFEEMSGYSQDEIVGRNCRFLQGDDRAQEALPTIRRALANREGMRGHPAQLPQDRRVVPQSPEHPAAGRSRRHGHLLPGGAVRPQPPARRRRGSFGEVRFG
jgi:PAS domain-containing protein